MERSDSQYYYPLNVAVGSTRNSVSYGVTCQEDFFGVSDGMGTKCQCGFSTECEDVSQIYTFNCEGGKAESEDEMVLSEQWNFKLDCPRDVDGHGLSVQIGASLDSSVTPGQTFNPEVYIGEKLVRIWGGTDQGQLPVSIASGEHDFYWKADYKFNIRYIKLFDTDCLISFDGTGSDDSLVDQVMEHANNFLDKLQNGDAMAVGIVAAAVLVPLFCCCLCCCLMKRNNGKVIYRFR